MVKLETQELKRTVNQRIYLPTALKSTIMESGKQKVEGD